jgi:hypothetical protein
MLGRLTQFSLDVYGSPLDRETILFHQADGLEHVSIRVADIMFDDTYFFITYKRKLMDSNVKS